jgi:Mor family transcriptional regulator
MKQETADKIRELLSADDTIPEDQRQSFYRWIDLLTSLTEFKRRGLELCEALDEYNKVWK